MKMSTLFIVSEQARYSKEMTCIAYGNFRPRDLTCIKNNISSPSFSAFLRMCFKMCMRRVISVCIRDRLELARWKSKKVNERFHMIRTMLGSLTSVMLMASIYLFYRIVKPSSHETF